MFNILRYILILDISLICNYFNCTELLYLCVPLIIVILNILKDHIKNININLTTYFIQFIFIIICMSIVKYTLPIIIVTVYNYFESEFTKIYTPKTPKIPDTSGIFISHSPVEKKIYSLEDVNSLNNDLNLYTNTVSLRTCIINLNTKLKINNLHDYFAKRDNIIKVKHLFDLTGCHPALITTYPFLARIGFWPQDTRIYISDESKSLLITALRYKYQVVWNLYVQVSFGILENNPNINYGFRKFWEDRLIDRFQKTYPAIFKEYERVSASDKGIRRGFPNILVWIYLTRLGNGYCNEPEMDIIFTQMNDFYNNNKQAIHYKETNSVILNQVNTRVWTLNQTNPTSDLSQQPSFSNQDINIVDNRIIPPSNQSRILSDLSENTKGKKKAR